MEGVACARVWMGMKREELLFTPRTVMTMFSIVDLPAVRPTEGKALDEPGRGYAFHVGVHPVPVRGGVRGNPRQAVKATP